MNAPKVEEISNDTNSFSWENYCKLANKSVHIIDLIQQKILEQEKFYSFELVSVKDFENYQRFFDEKKTFFPLFQSVTWHCKENVNKVNVENIEPFKIAKQLPNNTLLHLTAKGLTSKTIENILNFALESNIRNILALQGDSFLEVEETGDFVNACDLVSFIRRYFASKFCICVAGYPQMHPKSLSKETDLFYLKAKVDAGADFILSQIFFEAQVFIEFVKDCRKVGITVPIIPGIFPISNYNLLRKISTICNIEIPQRLLDALEPIKENDEKVEKFGNQFSKEMIREIFESGVANGFHLFTMNRLSGVLEIID